MLVLKIIRYFLKILGYIFIAFLLIVIASTLGVFADYRLLIVQSGSMEPVIKVGSLVISGQRNEYKVGDIITFQDLDNPKISITHRIVEINEEQEEKTFTTKGDANQGVDQENIPASKVFGKVLFTIPYAGYAVAYTKTKQGLTLLIVIPAVLIITSEIFSINSELKKHLKKKSALGEKIKKGKK